VATIRLRNPVKAIFFIRSILPDRTLKALMDPCQNLEPECVARWCCSVEQWTPALTRNVTPRLDLAAARGLADPAAEIDRPAVLVQRTDGEHLLAPFGRAARDVVDRGGMIDHDAEDAAERECLEGELRAHERERTDLAAQVGGGVRFTR
jgi:hypothetical protein